MHHTCWPEVSTQNKHIHIECTCGEFFYTAPVSIEYDAKRRYREHVMAVTAREANRMNQVDHGTT